MDVARLRKAVDWSFSKLQPFRQHRLKALTHYCGTHYSDDAAQARVPINLMELAVSIYTRQLAAYGPKVLCTTKKRELKSFSVTLEHAINKLMCRIDIAETLRAVVKDAMFGIGCAKVGLNMSQTVELGGYTHNVGEVFVDQVLLDDLVLDMSARARDQIMFCGNRYLVPKVDAENSGLFDKKLVKRIAPTNAGPMNENRSDERVDTLSKGGSSQVELYEDMIELWDIWLPRERRLVTLSCADMGSDDVLRNVEWEGPENGPFHFLSFNDVPGNLMPLPAVGILYDMHESANLLMNKLIAQGLRQKTLQGVSGGDTGDAQRICDAKDGEAVRIDAPDKTKEMRFGGVDAANFAFVVQLKDMFSYFAGNLDSLGGLSPQADTAAQEKMLASSSSVRIRDMQERTVEFTRKVVQDIAYYLWDDPVVNIEVTKKLPGVDVEIPAEFNQSTKQGDFYNYDIDIEPYSMQHKSPGQRLQTFMEFLQGIFIPLAGQMQQEGIVPNMEGIVRTFGRLANMEAELEDVVTFTAMPTGADAAGPGGGAPQRALQSPVTKRTYERVNRPGATRSGKDQVLVQALMGQASQPSENAAMTRPVG